MMMQTTLEGYTRPLQGAFTPAMLRRAVLTFAQVVRYTFAASLFVVAWLATAQALGGARLAYIVVGLCFLAITGLVHALAYMTPGATPGE
jgi:hypothetical protein